MKAGRRRKGEHKTKQNKTKAKQKQNKTKKKPTHVQAFNKDSGCASYVMAVKFVSRNLLACLQVETNSGRLFRRFSFGHEMIFNFSTRQRWHFFVAVL